MNRFSLWFRIFLLVFCMSAVSIDVPYCEDDTEEYEDEEGEAEGEEYEEGDDEEEYEEEFEDEGEFEDEEGDGEGGEEEFEDDSMKARINGVLDLLEENRETELKPEDFIYAFSDTKKPMLSNNLIPSVQSVADGFSGTRRKGGKKSKRGGRKLNSKGVGKLAKGFTGKFAGVQVVGARGGSAGGSKKAKVNLPDFEISGKFGTATESYIVIGSRFYTYGNRLKGSRELRKVTLEAIDDNLAFFKYKDVSFAKKIKALESVF